MGVAVSGGRAFLSELEKGIEIIDISDPTHPVSAGKCSTDGSAISATAVGDRLYSADREDGLQVIDVSNPSSPALLGEWGMNCYPSAIAMSGNRGYIASENGGLRIVDFSNPVQPALIGRCDTGGYAYDVAVSGNYAYVTDYDNGLQVFDVSNPAKPTQAGSCVCGGRARGLAISGSCAYVVYGAGLAALDISDCTSPRPVGKLLMPDGPWDITVAGRYAYLASSLSGLYILDLADPLCPAFVGQIETDGNARDTVVRGDYAYVADFSGGLKIIDVSNPRSPTLTGTCYTGKNAFGVAVSGDYAYLAVGPDGLQVVDISDPTAPTLVRSFDTSGSAVSVTASGDYVYVSDTLGGVCVFKINKFPPSVASITPSTAPNISPSYKVKITGSEFAPGMTVQLLSSTLHGIMARDVSVTSPTELTCTLCLAGAPAGQYDLTVITPGGSATLADAFTLTQGDTPVIKSVIATPSVAAAGDKIHVTALVCNDLFMAGLAANGTSLAHTDYITWEGDITASAALGDHNVSVVASDADGNPLASALARYTTARVVGLSSKFLSDSIVNSACGLYVFRAWGRVVEVSDSDFTLNDGSGSIIRVRAPGYKQKVQAGDYASARGLLNISGADRWLESASDFVTRY